MSEAYFGIYKGIVVDNNDPDHSFRIITQIPAVMGDAPSGWVEPILPTRYTPRVGDVVWIQFADGDVSQPLYQSRVNVVTEMIDPTYTDSLTIADFSITPNKMLNNVHYLY